MPAWTCTWSGEVLRFMRPMKRCKRDIKRGFRDLERKANYILLLFSVYRF